MWGIPRSPVNSPHKGQWRRALMFSLICVWINDWVKNREAGDLRRYRAHNDVILMGCYHYCDMRDRDTGRISYIIGWGLWYSCLALMAKRIQGIIWYFPGQAWFSSLDKIQSPGCLVHILICLNIDETFTKHGLNVDWQFRTIEEHDNMNVLWKWFNKGL